MQSAVSAATASHHGLATMRDLLRLALLFSPTLALLAGGGWYVATHLGGELPPDAVRPGGRLVVVVVFDQMRGDYLRRWPGLLGEDGFDQVKRDGVWYSNARLPHACTSTGPGHASIGTGAPPAVHGVVENKWYDRRTGQEVYCTSDAAARRVPGAKEPAKEPASLSPARLLVPGVAAHLKAVEKDARVFSLSLKDRAAVLMAGRCNDAGVYCFDSAVGKFHASSHYRADLPDWVVAFNKSRDGSPADAWFHRRWDRLLHSEKYVGRDDFEAEGRGVNGMGQTFPHPLKGKLENPARGFYDAVETSPFGNELLWDFARACLAAEQLGRRGTKDLLYLSFSSNDLVGHAWGPDSHEVQDITARSDRLLAEMIRHLDDTVGRANYTLVLTADHGVCPLPELTAATVPGVERFEPAAELADLGRALDDTFGPLGDKPESWVKKLTYPDLYLNDSLLEAEGKSRVAVERYAAEWIGNRPHMLAAFPRPVLAGPPLADPLARRVQLGWHPDRSGDVVVVHKPYLLPGKNTGGYSVAGHGTPHDYDTHVPLLAFGAGVPKLGERPEPTSSLAVAAIVCRALGIGPPAEAKEPLPAGW